MAPPEGDAGTGMTATNAVAPRTGNVSAGTSIFSMVVLEKNLSKVYEEIDMVSQRIVLSDDREKYGICHAVGHVEISTDGMTHGMHVSESRKGERQTRKCREPAILSFADGGIL